MLAKGGSRARGRRASGIVVGLGIAGALLGLTAAPAAALTAAPAPTASVADGVELAVIVPITAPAESTGLITATALAEYTATEPAGLLSRQLDAVAGTEAIIAVDPMILASIRVLGAAAPASARAWLERFESAPNERFALPYADADPTLFTASNAGAVLEPLGFGFAMNPADFASPTPTSTPEPAPTATPTPTPTPTPTVDPDAPPALPTDPEVPAVDGAVAGIVWPRAGTVTEADLPALGGTALVLGQEDVAEAAAVGGVATVADRRALVVSADSSSALTGAARAVDEATWIAAVADARTAIEAAVTAQTGPSGVVVVAFGRLDAAAAARLPLTLETLTADGTIRLAGLTDLLDANRSAPPATLVDGVHDVERVATINARLGSEAAVGGFATAVATPALLTDPARLQSLALGGQGWIGRGDWASVVDASIAEVNALLASVHVVDANFQFFADRSMLPISIQNDGAQQVTLIVSAQPRTGLLDLDEESLEVVVPAGSQATVEFGATAVSNGTVIVTVWMTSPAGVPIGSTSAANVNVQAGWETPIVAAAAVAVGLLLVFGVVRTILRVRASRRDTATARETTAPETRTDDAPASDG